MKLAVKLLSLTDLTMFGPVFKARPTSGQKGINLNKGPLQQIYPALPPYAPPHGLPVTLDIYGPGGAPLQRVASKFTKAPSAKNWRLAGGAVITELIGQEGRYSHFAPGDIAVFGFSGEPSPEVVSLVLFARSDPNDRLIVQEIVQGLGLEPRASMFEVSPEDLAQLVAGAAPRHPIHLLLEDFGRSDELLEAAAGDDDAAAILYERGKRGRTRPVSWEELAAADERNRNIGRRGEEIIDHMLASAEVAGTIASYTWEARENAASPFDFSLTQAGGQSVLIDVKTTPSEFGTRFFLSTYEVKCAANDPKPYHIYRVYDLEGQIGPKLRRSSDITTLAAALLDALAGLPNGVSVSSVMLDADAIAWDDPEDLELPPAVPAEAD